MTSDTDLLRFTAPYRVRFDEAGPDGCLRTAGVLRYAQDVGWQHSEARGLTRAWYGERGLAWVVRAVQLDVLRPIEVGLIVDVTTRVTGFQRFWAQRQAELRLTDGELAATVRADWVMIDGSGRLTRLPAEIVERFPASKLDQPLLRVSLPDTPLGAASVPITVGRRDLDPMDHPNNAVYVDWLEESLFGVAPSAATVVGSVPRRLRLEYTAAPAVGDRLAVAAWPSDDGWAVRMTSDAGADVLRATLSA